MESHISLVICLFITLFLIGCNNKQDNIKKIEETQTTLTEEVTEQKEESESEYIELNEDGVAPLEGTEESEPTVLWDCTSDSTYSNIKNYGTDTVFHVVVNISKQPIQKLRKSDTAAIYRGVEYVSFYKIISDPVFTVPLNFADFSYNNDDEENESRVNNRPTVFPVDVVHNEYRERALDIEIEEINGNNINSFVNDNSEIFWQHTEINGVEQIYLFKLLNLEKNDELVFGGYTIIDGRGVDTNWVESHNYKASTDFYYAKNESIDIPTTKTKNGYFIINTSELEDGIYYADSISGPGRLIEIV